MSEEVKQTTQVPVETPIETMDHEEKTQPADKSVGGLKFYKEQLEKERVAREQIQKELESIKTSKMKEQNQWKELYEVEQKKSMEAQERLSQISEALVADKMRIAIEKEVSKLGLVDSALEDLDMLDKSMIEIETTSSGKVHFNNVKEWAENLRAKKPHWFNSNAGPAINNKRPGSYEKVEISADEILALEKTDKAAYYKLMQERLAKR